MNMLSYLKTSILSINLLLSGACLPQSIIQGSITLQGNLRSRSSPDFRLAVQLQIEAIHEINNGLYASANLLRVNVYTKKTHEFTETSVSWETMYFVYQWHDDSQDKDYEILTKIRNTDNGPYFNGRLTFIAMSGATTQLPAQVQHAGLQSFDWNEVISSRFDLQTAITAVHDSTMIRPEQKLGEWCMFSVKKYSREYLWEYGIGTFRGDEMIGEEAIYEFSTSSATLLVGVESGNAVPK